jgi:hypothetical protein
MRSIARLKTICCTLLLSTPALCFGQWNLVPSPDIDSFHNNIYGIGGSGPNDVWTVGSYQKFNTGTASYETENLLMHWNGSGWTPYFHTVAGNTGEDAINDVVAFSPTNAYAGGLYTNGLTATKPQLMHWNGTAWADVPMPAVCNNGSITSLKAFSATDIWAGGTLNDGIMDSTYMLHFNGTTWNAMPVLPLGLSAVNIQDIDGTSSTDLWAVGGSNVGTLAMHFDGTSWTDVPIPLAQFPGLGTAGHVKAIGHNSIVLIVDDFAGSVKLLLYEGSTWSAITVPPGGSNSLYPVVISATNIFHWANTGIYHFDGTGWTVVDTVTQPGSPDVTASAILPDGSVWVGGFSIESSNRSRKLVYRSTAAMGVQTAAWNSAGLRVFPNPGNGSFTLRMDGLEKGPATVSVSDLSGKLVCKQMVGAGSANKDVPVRIDGPAGIYVLMVSGSGFSKTFSLIKR